MALDFPALLADLRTDSDQLLAHLSKLPAERWQAATPAQSWSIQDQVSHLAYFDGAALLALTDPTGLRTTADELMAAGMDFPDRLAVQYRTMAPADLLDWFADIRRDLLAAFSDEDPKRRVPWFGPDMSVASSATARLMETWAHGRDVYDTIAVCPAASGGLRSIAHLGVVTFAFSHLHHGLEVPEAPVHVALTSPTGELWTWGPAGAENRISGTAEDFVLVVTQRRHWSETGLTVVGEVATGWLDIAQAFAGAPSRRLPSKVQA
ncbi:TIGR03084 family metal-binding protein [Mycobacterium sp. C31M]